MKGYPLDLTIVRFSYFPQKIAKENFIFFPLNRLGVGEGVVCTVDPKKLGNGG